MLAASAMALVAAGCESLPTGATGAGAGGLLAGLGCAALGGNTTECILAGVAGAAVGALIENELSEREKERRDAALAQAIQSGENASWTEEQSGTSGNIEVLRTFENAGRECEEIRETYNGPQGPIVDTYSVCLDDNGLPVPL